MAEMKSYEEGTFCWADLGTNNLNGAQRFYSELFAWKLIEQPISGGVYATAQVRGKGVAALAPLPPDLQKAGVPPHWNCYVSVKDVDAATKRALSLGGKAIAPPFDVMDAGRMSVIQDPSGVPVSLWQPKRHAGAELLHEAGALTWTELYTRDPKAACDFFGKLFGWTFRERTMGPTTYTVFSRGGKDIAGMLPIAEEWGPMPACWMTYFKTDDCGATLEKAKRMHGKVLAPVMKAEDIGSWAVLADPQGAAFGILQSNR